MKNMTDEERLLFKPYVFFTTIKRYFSLNEIDTQDVFIKAQELDEKKGYIKLYDDRVRSESVWEVLGLSLDVALKRYEIKKELMRKLEKEN